MLTRAFILYIIFNLNFVIAKEIPIIVIAPGKTIQSKSTVGSDISVLEEKEINQSNDFFIGDILNDTLPGMGMFQSGGHGTVSGIQMRGLPGRYATIYIDGVKMSDPSTPDNRYYNLNSVSTSSIEQVEILKGTHSSLYGSNSISGSIHIHTKKAKEKGIKQDVSLIGGSHNTQNLTYNLLGKKDSHDFSFNLNKFVTDGISAMNDNEEEDRYRAEGISGKYGYQINDTWRIENNLRYEDSLLEYDEVTHYNTYNDNTSGKRADANSTDNYEASYNFRLIQNKDKFKNQLIINKYKAHREVQKYDQTPKGSYSGYRDSINYLGEYNYNLDIKIVYGLDNELEKAKYNTWATPRENDKEEYILSQYADVQFRPLEKLYGTFGLRRDDHRTAGEYYTARVTFAYNKDSNTKYRTAFGNGIKFATLNDYYYDTNLVKSENLKPEQSWSIDFGIDRYIDNLDLDLSLTIFFIQYEDNISGWEGNLNENGTSYAIKNSSGKIKNKGIEFFTSKILQDNLEFNFNYTFIDSYDGEDCDDPADTPALCIDEQGVLVPRHSFNIKLTKSIDNLNLILNAKYVGERRDYGNFNSKVLFGKYTTSHDMILDDYITLDLLTNLRANDRRVYFFNIKNLLNKDYEPGHQYNGLDRTLNFGVKKVF